MHPSVFSDCLEMEEKMFQVVWNVYNIKHTASLLQKRRTTLVEARNDSYVVEEVVRRRGPGTVGRKVTHLKIAWN